MSDYAGIREVDVAVIGGGPAGIAAAIAARKEGALKVVVFERDWEAGGILQQCIHPGFGLHMFGLELTGPEYMDRYLKQAYEAGVEFALNTMVFQMDPPAETDGRKTASFWIMSPKTGIEKVHAKSVVLAMGCRERPAGALGIAGSRPAGVYTAGTAQRFVNMEGCMPGKKAVIMGTGDIGLIMARRMMLEGAEVVAVFEIMPWVSGLRRNVAQCLDDFGIPYYLEHSVCELHGKDRLEGISVVKIGKDRRPVDGTLRFVGCDTLLLAVGLIPENELSRMAGVEISPLTNGPVVNDFLQTSADCIFASGNVVVVYDLVDFVSEAGERAGSSAALYAMGKLSKPRELPIETTPNIRVVSPQKLCGGRDTTVFVRVAEPIEGRCRLFAEPGIFSQTLRYARPGEMNEVKISAEKFRALPETEKCVRIGIEAF
ncbi:MAG: NAD(P)/FAD-dependent oxidoreductase [Synergistaceae bacterium]|jgi:NADPH-dependent 2,4-dienoyl-CoA reductase/sulfur reductase-like enzyme|nr:NAD(P)/FAD-dependent oxidoreductase [Synergistaceae bacterium]